MKRSCLLALSVWFTLSLSAQKSFEPGYIVAMSGDTINGQISFNTEKALTQSVSFRTGVAAAPKTWLPGEIAAFGFSRTVYRSLTFVNTAGDSAKQETKFCRLVEDGSARLFALPEQESYFYLIQREKDILFLYPTQLSWDGDVRKESNYRNMLTVVAAECLTNTRKPESVLYTEGQLATFVHRVNLCVAPEKSQSYKEKARMVKSLVLSGGSMQYIHGNQTTGSLLFRLVNTNFSPKVSLNAGFLYAQKRRGILTDYIVRPDSIIVRYRHRLYVHQILFSVPVTVQYTFASGRVQPFFYGGFGLVKYHDHRTEQQFDQYPNNVPLTLVSLILGAGVDVRLVDQLYFRAEERIETFVHYPTAGLSYRYNW